MKMGCDVKIVFLDSGITKVVKGILLHEDDFSFKIKCHDGAEIIIGKAVLVKMTQEGSF